MTSFVPNTPHRKWHPSQWNLVRVGAAIGATLGLGACADDVTTLPVDEVGTESEGTEAEYTEYSEYSDWSEYSEYTDYSDYSEYTDYSDYSEYSDWSEEYTDYSDYSEWSDNTDNYYYECYTDEDCGPQMQCLYNSCVPFDGCLSSADCAIDEFCDEDGLCNPVTLSSQCLAPALQEIPLPNEAGGEVLALRFVDVDDDPAEELVLLRADALIVIDGDLATTVPHSAYSLDGIAATDVDGDGAIDLVGTSSTKLNSRVFFADGLGGFVDSGVGPGMRLDNVDGLDWPLGGVGELLAMNQANEAVLLSDLAQLMPTSELLEAGPVDDLVAGDFDGDSQPDYALLESCQPVIQHQSGETNPLEAIGPLGTCSITSGDFDAADNIDLAVVRADDSFTVVAIQTDTGPASFVVGLVGVYQIAQPTRFGGAQRSMLVQAGPELEYMFVDGNMWCRGLLDELPPTRAFATGDFDGDGTPELATIEVGGGARLWSDD